MAEGRGCVHHPALRHVLTAATRPHPSSCVQHAVCGSPLDEVGPALGLSCLSCPLPVFPRGRWA